MKTIRLKDNQEKLYKMKAVIVFNVLIYKIPYYINCHTNFET